jgi:putative peptidoglycan lipid II flippase
VTDIAPPEKPAQTSDQPKKAGGLLKSSMIYSGLTLVSRFMGFARDLAVSYRMGASATPAADAYNAALAFPNLFRRFFAEGAFAAAFVPPTPSRCSATARRRPTSWPATPWPPWRPRPSSSP